MDFLNCHFDRSGEILCSMCDRISRLPQSTHWWVRNGSRWQRRKGGYPLLFHRNWLCQVTRFVRI
jgi:hypothetical protein